LAGLLAKVILVRCDSEKSVMPEYEIFASYRDDCCGRAHAHVAEMTIEAGQTMSMPGSFLANIGHQPAIVGKLKHRRDGNRL